LRAAREALRELKIVVSGLIDSVNNTELGFTEQVFAMSIDGFDIVTEKQVDCQGTPL